MRRWEQAIRIIAIPKSKRNGEAIGLEAEISQQQPSD